VTGPGPMRTVDEHVAGCLAAVGVLAPVDVALADALDLLLAAPVRSGLDLPRFDNSAMDGYAVRLADVAGAAPGTPVALPVRGDVAAGAGAVAPLAPGAAVRIMTGAPLPSGTEAVVPVEWTDARTDTVTITRVPGPGQFLRHAGEDVRAGEEVLAGGVRLAPRHLALLAAVGRATVSVHPRARVVVISSGSELTPAGEPLPPGHIHDSNGPGLVAAARDLGSPARHAGIVADDADAVRAALADAAAHADLVITSGGVSAGAYDTVKAVLRDLGGVTFGKVAMQPGMPQGFGTLAAPDGRAVPVFTLPGNPVSSMVSFEVFVRPVLRRLAGEATLHRPAVPAVAGASWSSPAGRRQFVRATLAPAPDGGPPVATPVGGQGSHLVADLAAADCLVVVPDAVTEVAAGSPVTCLPLERGRR